jgi:NAD(P)-dependent dehydrogenase (short-subunit alcohol dehydrogenase family)
MKQVIAITGASSGFGRLTANALAKTGHIVYASMRETTGRNAAVVADEGRHGRACRGLCARIVALGIETSIIVPGAFTGGTNHFAHSGKPTDAARVVEAEYEAGP